MKRSTIILMALFAIGLAMVILPIVLADDNTSANAGTENPVLIAANPNAQVSDSISDLNVSEDVSSWRMGWKQVGIWLTFDQEKKAQLELDLARLQLIRTKIAAMKNDSTAMEKALDAHDKLLNDFEARAEKLSNAGGNVTGLNRAIAVHEARIQKLNELLASANLTDAQKSKFEARLMHIENVTAHLSNLNTKIESRVQKIENRTGRTKSGNNS